MDSFLLEMEVLVEKTENNTPIFESVRKQVDDTKKAIDSSKAKAEELINNIRISIAKVLYIAQLTDYISVDDLKD
jgi:phage-related tail protein